MRESPEINLARRILKKFELIPPVDVFTLVSHYASIDVLSLPLDVDGISLNLKVPGKRPTVILNSNRPNTRKRFTLAHELGHVLIPWHIGTIIDEIYLFDNAKGISYWELENEANRFAGELLMPRNWVKNLIDTFDNPCEAIKRVIEIADVSTDAATIRVQQILCSGYVYALLDEQGFVISSGRSAGTLTTAPEKRLFLDKDTVFPVSDARWEWRMRDRVWVWWHFPNEVSLPILSDTRDWREILEGILYDLQIDPTSAVKMKQTINGIVGYVNGIVRRDPGRNTPEALYAASMQRFNSRALDDSSLRKCMEHRDFPIYLAKRVTAFDEGCR